MSRKEEMLSFRKEGFTYKELGEIFGCSRQYVHQVIMGDASLPETPPSWKRMQTAVFVRDNHKCVVCKNKEFLQVHHIDYNHENNNIGNLATLCRECHYSFHRIKNKTSGMRYALRLACAKKNTIEVTFPREVVERAANIRGMTVPEFIASYQAGVYYGEGEEVTYILEKR